MSSFALAYSKPESMRKHVLFAFLCIVFTTSLRAQFVTIPDANFATYLQTLVPSCITGNQLDTTCTDLASVTLIGVGSMGISDLSGIEHFTGLSQLNCDNNLLTTLPTLPGSLLFLYAGNNFITSVASFPPNLTFINLWNNNLSYLPNLPPNLNELWIDNNPNLMCLPELPNSLTTTGWVSGLFIVYSSGFECIPNLPTGMTTAFPICLDGDTLYNSYNCNQVVTISGKVFEDDIANCSYDTGETPLYWAKIWLIDNVGDTIASSYSYTDGKYSFVAPPGTYTVALETSSVAYQASCLGGQDSTFTFATSIANVDFGVECLAGYDIGNLGIIPLDFGFPGLTATLKVGAGDISQLNNLSCATSVGGQVIVNVTGPCTYLGPISGALVPTSVSGNTLTYDVADFSAVNFYSDFGFEVLFDTTATAGDTVCVLANVTPVTGDNQPLNNISNLCFPIFNSFDPNTKDVYPTNVDPGYDDWLTYTIHFQNTGNASAMNIKLRDTLDVLLRLNTFELLAASHPVEVNLTGHKALFKFDNIMLPDSASDPTGSIGWIQYRVKPESGLPDGTEINNKCYIYFDYNAPILTNTATTFYNIDDLGASGQLSENLIVYPNPSSGIFNFTFPANTSNENCLIAIYNLAGEEVMELTTSNSGIISLDLTSEKSGIYFMTISNGEQIATSKLVKY